MNKNISVEVCVDSLQSAINAEQGGANRIELCANLINGGTTPSAGLIKLTRKYVNIDINVMIRPRGGDFCYSQLEFEVIKNDIIFAKENGANGIVFGILKPNGEIDTERMKEIIDLARPLSITFHRAFDMTVNPYKSLKTLIGLGVDRILTSGHKKTALDGIELIKELIDKSNNKVIIMPGSGITTQNVNNIITKTDVCEIHLSAKKKVNSMMIFKNKSISMGGNEQFSEYENFIADKELIKSVCNICNKSSNS